MKKLMVLVAILLAFAPVFAEAKVTAVRGTVGVLANGRLQVVTVGMSLLDDATVVTGANSEVVIQINNGTITLRSLTTAKLTNMTRTNEASTANVALRGGTVVSNVQQIQGLRTNFTVTTPVATSSVRGTAHTVSFSQERGMEVAVSSGLVAITSALNGNRPVPAGTGFTQANASSAPLLASQASLEAPPPIVADAFASDEEVAISQNAGNASAVITVIVDAIAPVPDIDDGLTDVPIVILP